MAEVLSYCSVCGARVSDYRPGEFSMNAFGDYGLIGKLKDSDTYWCANCGERCISICLTDTGTICRDCDNHNPMWCDYCAWCGIDLRPK
jgi:hypothetical protein